MNKLPSGTVTFLFTDIEGSTRLWQEQPEAMAIAHARHDEILRATIESNHGYVFQIVGDSLSAANLFPGDWNDFSPEPALPFFDPQKYLRL